MKTLKYITIIIIVLILLSPIVIIKYNTNITARQIALFMVLLLYFNGICGILKAINKKFNNYINIYSKNNKAKLIVVPIHDTPTFAKSKDAIDINGNEIKRVCIKGDPYKSQAIIDYFEALGFVNSLNLTCCPLKLYYYGVNGRIFYDNKIPEGYTEIEL